jgi:GDPmannose 4,6-dehydratase
MKRAFITGITGQDGSYLTELLLEKGYEVHGLVRRSSSFNRARIDPIWQTHPQAHDHLHLHYGDMTDGANLVSMVADIQPDEVYNLAAQSHVKVSFEMPEFTASTDGLGPVRLLEAVRTFAPEARFYQASTSEMFGSSPPPQHEHTPFNPRSPYGTAKLYAHWATVNYRDAYDMFAVSGILFNHESPRRGESFVTRKITMAAARIKLGLAHELHLGNLDAVRDWGFAKEYVEGMWRMLQHDVPDTFVLGTGIGTTVREFAETAFSHIGLDWQEYVRHDDSYERPNEADALVADTAKANDVLDWKAETDAKQLARLMVDADLALVEASLG